MPLPTSLSALVAELERVERVGRAFSPPQARRLFAIERRRLVVAIDRETHSEIAAA
jgi:hypothetical protein